MDLLTAFAYALGIVFGVVIFVLVFFSWAFSLVVQIATDITPRQRVLAAIYSLAVPVLVITAVLATSRTY